MLCKTERRPKKYFIEFCVWKLKILQFYGMSETMKLKIELPKRFREILLHKKKIYYYSFHLTAACQKNTNFFSQVGALFSR